MRIFGRYGKACGRYGLLSVVLFSVLLLSCTSGKKALDASSPTVQQRQPLSHNDEMRFKTFFHEALNQQMKGQYALAFEMLRHCLTIDPQASEVYYLLSAYYNEMRNDSLSLACMKKAAELDGTNDYYLERLAGTYITNREYDKAGVAFEKLYSNHKDRTDVLGLLLQLYGQQRDYDKVLSTLDRLEMVEGTNEEMAMTRMRAYAMQGRKDEEFGVLKDLSEKHPADMNYRVMMGNWLLQNGQHEEALQQYQQVLEAEPENVQGKMSLMDYYRTTGDDSLANVLQEQMLIDPQAPSSSKLVLMRRVVQENEEQGGDSTEVLSLFHRMLAEPQKNSDMTELYAAYMKLKNMPQDSINGALKSALRIAPDNAGVRLQLIQSLWDEKDYDQIIRLSEEAVEYNPDEMAFYYFLGLSHFQKDERDEALDAFRRGVGQINEESNPNIVSDFYAIMGDILHEKGKVNEAYAAYDSSLQWKPDNVGTLNNYAYYISEEGGDLEKAEHMSQRTVKAEPSNATYLDTYAWILFKQERYSEAKEYIDQAMKNDSTANGVIIEHAGDIYALNKDIPRAVELWKKAQEAGEDSKVLIRKIKLRKYIKK